MFVCLIISHGDHRYGLECLFRFYSFGLEHRFREPLWHDFNDLVKWEFRKGGFYGASKLWGCVVSRAMRRVSCLLVVCLGVSPDSLSRLNLSLCRFLHYQEPAEKEKHPVTVRLVMALLTSLPLHFAVFVLCRLEVSSLFGLFLGRYTPKWMRTSRARSRRARTSKSPSSPRQSRLVQRTTRSRKLACTLNPSARLLQAVDGPDRTRPPRLAAAEGADLAQTRPRLGGVGTAPRSVEATPRVPLDATLLHRPPPRPQYQNSKKKGLKLRRGGGSNISNCKANLCTVGILERS